MHSWRCWFLGSLLLILGCTKPVPGVCCLDAADCASIGVSEPERPCTEGLACVNNACVVPSCSTDGCSAEAPVCNITLDVCTGCTGPADCDQFAESPQCNVDGGACVECLTNSDCSARTPSCDGGACRGCELDSECESGACAMDGTCTAEVDTVYVSPAGTDNGTCTRSEPCLKLQFAISKATTTRNHVVMENGTYDYLGSLSVLETAGALTGATSIHVHGGGSRVTYGQSDGQVMFKFQIPTTLTDLRLEFPLGRVVQAVAPTTLKRVSISSEVCIEVGANVVVEDVTTVATAVSVKLLGGSLDMKRSVLRGGLNGISGNTNLIQLENVLVRDTSNTGIDLTTNGVANGSIAFVTVVNTGITATTGAAGLKCSSANVEVQSTIVWTPQATLTAMAGCTASSTIAGPVGAVGAFNQDPQFVDLAAGDYHLSVDSPAKDMVNTGPALDYEGDPRPSGVRFDIGADEARR